MASRETEIDVRHCGCRHRRNVGYLLLDPADQENDMRHWPSAVVAQGDVELETIPRSDRQRRHGKAKQLGARGERVGASPKLCSTRGELVAGGEAVAAIERR